MIKDKQNIKTVSWKVCGMRDQKNIYDVLTLEPDYMGFIMYPPSSRFIEREDVSFLEEKWSNDIQTKRVGVFVNEEKQTILDFAKKYHFDVIQLHGKETPELCQSLKEKGFEVFKVFGIKDEFNFEVLKPYEAFVDYFLFDTKSPKHGGTGETFDWGVLEQYNSTKPFLLSGGLSLENIKNIRKLDHLPCKGIDVNSKFEISPALKDVEQLTSLSEWVKSINDK
ncbi:phosphoribosylanthranilate isomerase [Flammeovirga yaeyamensis]|uniref:N-(5'-phosphoribosyl)anthranilate isomerase n=1 Tax=Flammeovirga yaeyamensis TaxID=367791 RepID=A0AAX1N2M3_9BACT|nr:phosphoribosylanthranilate isomerase [Flammeovirga yaeyamensis]MBB3701211.1 phosphoribosylanthranilate isomerase [Flammeovirga yaeyamensis]NMF38463.1 phosphoribosylanthranilate isomerase [Flammeovirga yaeyamensis]QWG01677.1 phosphoribosylanthranilate isomerase [Flammeovirga yaeyamensis]